MTRFRRAGWKVLFFPGAEVDARRRRLARRPALRREPARPSALVRQAPRREGGRARCGGCCSSSLRLRALVLRRPEYRDGRSLPLVRQRPRADQVIVYLRLAFGTLLRPRSRLGRRARVRPAERCRRCSRGRSPPSSSRGRSSSRSTARSTSRSPCSLVIFVGALVAAATTRRTGFELRPGAWVWLVGIVLGWFSVARRGRRDRRRPVPRGARPEARRPRRRCTCARVDEFKDGGLHPGLRVPALARAPRARLVVLAASIPEPSSATSRRCSRRSRARSPRRRASPSSARARPAASLLVALARGLLLRPGHGGSYATLSLPATAARQLLVPAAIALFFSGPPRPRRPRSSARSRSRIRRTRSSCWSRSLRTPLVRLAEWRALVADARGRARADGARPALAEADRRRDDLARSRAGRAPARARSSTATSSWSRTTTTTGSRPRSSAAAARSPSPRSSLLPLAGLALRRGRWAAFALGGTLRDPPADEVPWLFVHLSDAVVALAGAPDRRASRR